MLRNWLGEVFNVERTIQGTTIPTKRYKFEELIDGSRDHLWKRTTKFSCFETIHCSSQTWKAVAFEVAVSHQTGLTSPCVLLCNDNVSGSVTLVVAMVNEYNYSYYGEIPSGVIPDNGMYHLRDGPSVLWCCHNGLAMLSTSNTNKMTLNFFSTEQLFNLDNTSRLACTLNKIWVLSGQQEADSLRIFGRAYLSSSDLNPPKRLKSVGPNVLWCTATISQQEGLPIITKSPESLYIRSDYASVINCITEYDNCDPYMLTGPHQDTQYVVGTTYQQMLIFSNGKVLHCTSLECVPFAISVCQLGALDAFIVQDGTASVFVYALHKTGFVLQRRWTGVFTVLTDDFVGNGNEQLLVVMDDPASDGFSLSNFVLTDLDTIEVPSPQNGVDEGQRNNSDTMSSAVSALQKRLMHEKNVLDELQLEYLQKKLLLNKATELLTCLDKGSAHEWTPDQHLVPLLEPAGSQGVPTGVSLSSGSVKDDIGTLDVVKTWQRVMDSQWVVGIIVVNNTSSPVTQVTATVACTMHTVIRETRSVLFPDQPAPGGSLPIMGRTDSQLGHGQTANVVCVTDLPAFTSDKIEVGVLLCWEETRGDDNKVRTRYAGHVQLTVEEVYSTSLCCDSVIDWCHPVTEHVCQDQMTYLITHQITELEFKSLFTDLRKLPEMLKTCLPPSNHLIVSADSATPTVAQLSPTHMPFPVIIIPAITERRYASIKALYNGKPACIYPAVAGIPVFMIRESSKFSVLLQLLKGSLASDVGIQSVDDGWRETICKCYQQLQGHLEHLIAITDEQLKTGRVATENEVYNYKVDMAMKDVMELVEND